MGTVERHPGPAIRSWPEGVPVPMLRDELALAVFWCRFGGLGPQERISLKIAEKAGLLGADLYERVTPAGEDYLARALFDAPYLELPLGAATGHKPSCVCERCWAPTAAASAGKARVRRELEQGAAA